MAIRRSLLTAGVLSVLIGLVAPAAPTIAASPPIGVSTRVLVILAEWSGADAMNVGTARDLMFNQGSDWFTAVSDGAVTQHGDVTPWVHINGPANGTCESGLPSILTQAETAARAAGWDATDYERTVVYVPAQRTAAYDCTGKTGFASHPGRSVWLFGDMSLAALTHEQGHNYGLSHAHTYTCYSTVLAAPSSCRFGDDDVYDAMGPIYAAASYSAKQRHQLGWLPATTLTFGTSTTLAPLENPTGVRAAVVHATPTREYWLEYRQPILEDFRRLPGGATNGVIIHVVDPAISHEDAAKGLPLGPALLDLSPANNLNDATLKAGQSWLTPEGLRISVGAVTSSGATVSLTSTRPAVADFTGDGRSDAAVYRPGTATWWVKGNPGTAYGAATDIPVPADYNGDGRSDLAVWRPSTGQWWVRGSAAVSWGVSGDIPVPGDYDRDGRSDIAVWRPSNATWYVKGSPAVAYGSRADVPVPADYNGDGRTDIATWRPSTGTWWVRGSAGVTFGAVGDIVVPGDYNGDRRTDLAVWRPPAEGGSGTWYVRGLSTTSIGARGDIPTPGDFTGDLRTDPSVWSPSTGTWTAAGLSSFEYGSSGDIPLELPPAIRITQLGTR